MYDTGSDYLFTYGTLMKGYENPLADQLKSQSTFIGYAHMAGLIYLVSWYPGAIYLPDSDQKVKGEVYKISDNKSLLPLLDEYEDVFEGETSSLYLRKVIPVYFESGDILNCWTYLYNQPVSELTRIEDGNFRSI